MKLTKAYFEINKKSVILDRSGINVAVVVNSGAKTEGVFYFPVADVNKGKQFVWPEVMKMSACIWGVVGASNSDIHDLADFIERIA